MWAPSIEIGLPGYSNESIAALTKNRGCGIPSISYQWQKPPGLCSYESDNTFHLVDTWKTRSLSPAKSSVSIQAAVTITDLDFLKTGLIKEIL